MLGMKITIKTKAKPKCHDCEIKLKRKRTSQIQQTIHMKLMAKIPSARNGTVGAAF